MLFLDVRALVVGGIHMQCLNSYDGSLRIVALLGSASALLSDLRELCTLDCRPGFGGFENTFPANSLFSYGFHPCS